MRYLLTFFMCILVLSNFSFNSCHAQSKLQFSVKGKTYTAGQCYADLKKNDKGEYTLTIVGKGDGFKEINLFIYDAMSTMPTPHRDDPPMQLGVYSNEKTTLTGGMFSIAFADDSYILSNEGAAPPFRLTLTKLDVKQGLVSGTFEGPMDHITDTKQVQISNGVFTNIPIKSSY